MIFPADHSKLSFAPDFFVFILHEVFMFIALPVDCSKLENVVSFMNLKGVYIKVFLKFVVPI